MNLLNLSTFCLNLDFSMDAEKRESAVTDSDFGTAPVKTQGDTNENSSIYFSYHPGPR